MIVSITRALSFCCAVSLSLASAQTPAPAMVRMVDLNGDRELDLFAGMADGTLIVSLGTGDRNFERLFQELPSTVVTDVVASDLNRDGFVDLYLVTPHANFGLVGDGTGLFSDATFELGLQDEGVGQSAMLRDFDGDDLADLMLLNQTGDVLFWGVPGGFERDARTPFVPAPLPVTPLAGEAILPAPGLPGRDSEDVTVSTLEFPNGHSTARRHVGSDPTAPRLPEPGGSNSTAPAQAVIAPIAPSQTIGSIRGVPKLQVGLSLQQKQVLALLSVVDLPDGIGGMVQTLRLSGANFQVVNGLGVTESLNGLGNLIVGYNELRGLGDDRTGSHNIVGGNQNNFTGVGGHVVGKLNAVSSTWASVSGGRDSTASGSYSSVSGGYKNLGSGAHSSVTGGFSNTASGNGSSVTGGLLNLGSGGTSSVSGGKFNTAYGYHASVSGGEYNYATAGITSVTGGLRNTANYRGASVSGGSYNIASSKYASVSGGFLNIATGDNSSVSGGRGNAASGSFSSVTGGRGNSASFIGASVSGGYLNVASFFDASISGGKINRAYGDASSISGGLANSATSDNSSVSGGNSNRATDTNSSVSGGAGNNANGDNSSVSGGLSRTATGAFDWVAGSLFEDD